MAEGSGSVPDEALRQLGRMWNRLVWSTLLVLAVFADFTVIAFAPVGYWYPFIAGLATGMILAGLIVTLSRERHASTCSEADKSR